MAYVSEVAKGIYMIDDQLYSIPRWGSVYLLNEEKKALIESGPTTSANAVLEGIKEIGVKPEDISYLIVTHIHLDHAGGAGALARYMPRAEVMVHDKGARHLIDPARLVKSAKEARGDEFVAMHGEVLPIEKDRVRAINDGDTINLSSGQTLTFMDTPGHAPHHLCIYESKNGGLFAGDAVAVYIAEYDILLPFHPPPQFDLELCLTTLQELQSLSAQKIYYSHFGVSDRFSEHISRARKKLMVWDEMAREAATKGTFAGLRERLISQASLDLEPIKGMASLASLYNHLTGTHIPMCADGHINYYRKILKLK